MNTLHIINKAPSHAHVFDNCFKSIDENDGVILIENAVYALLSSAEANKFKRASRLYYLSADAEVRGIKLEDGSNISAVDYAEFVELCARYTKTISWI